MEELGIVVDRLGKYMKFGKWKSRNERKYECDDHWHSDSFRNEILDTEWFKNLNIPYDRKKELHNQLSLFATTGNMIIINDLDDENNKTKRILLVMALPNNLTTEQIEYLLKNKEYFKRFENNNISYIEILKVDEDYEVENAFFDLDSFYEYIEEIINTKAKQKCISRIN